MHTINIAVETIEEAERQLVKALAKVRKIKKQTKTQVKTPKFWTKKQWEEAEKEADEDIKAGRVSKPFDNIEDLIKELHS